jgi:predicted PurR-regulated permease PerM
VLAVACLYWAKAVLIPVALAIVFTFLLNPVASMLQRRGLPRTPAVLLVVLLAFSWIAGIGWTVTRQITLLAAELPRYQENLQHKVADLRDLTSGGVVEKVQTTITHVVGELQKAPPSEPLGPSAGGAATAPEKPVLVAVQPPSLLWQLPALLEPLATAGLVIVLVIFALIRYADLRGRLIHLAGYGRLTIATKALDEAGQRISRYLLMQSIINGSYGCALGLSLFLIGVPYAILWGFLAALLRFIPYAGPAVGAFLPSLLSLAVFPGWGQPLLVVGIILLLELGSNMIMEPLLYGQSAGVSEVALLVAVAFWTWLWGPVGLFLATPLTVCLGVLSKYVPHLEFIAVLLSDEPVMEPHISYYQRLVARDHDEAAAVVDDYLHTHPHEEVYDAILIPALNAAKHDRVLEHLTDDDEQFIVSTTRAIIEDLATRDISPFPAAPAPAASTPDAPVSGLPVRVIGCPAEDDIDELALLMLRQLLDPRRATLNIMSAELLTAEVLSAVEEQHVQLICIATLPPSALAPTRYLCKKLRARFPECKIVVGRWGLAEDDAALLETLREACVDDAGTTLRETSRQVQHLTQLLSSLASPSSSSASGPAAAPSRPSPRPR